MSCKIGTSLLAALALITGLTLYLRKSPAPRPEPEPLSESGQIVSEPPKPERAETLSPTGNEQAIAGLVNIAAATPGSIRHQVTEALKAAAANGSQSAGSALKQMSDSNQDPTPSK